MSQGQQQRVAIARVLFNKPQLLLADEQTAEKSFIDLTQTRFDIDGLVNRPLSMFDSFRFKLGATDYKHTEKTEDGTPATDFANKALETRWELTHAPLAGWHGSFGVQTAQNRFSALSAEAGKADTVPITKSISTAGFLVEERDYGSNQSSARRKRITCRSARSI
ncbi:ATP-binding cassette domain-containing protein [Noviherbaspirillum cavernae]|uniref:ATP-binding cassette domain-containing protein n=1 Tax=Noviherbaspirillum cavernae TaxID=2320862 RepID=UPI0011C3F4F7